MCSLDWIFQRRMIAALIDFHKVLIEWVVAICRDVWKICVCRRLLGFERAAEAGMSYMVEIGEEHSERSRWHMVCSLCTSAYWQSVTQWGKRLMWNNWAFFHVMVCWSPAIHRVKIHWEGSVAVHCLLCRACDGHNAICYQVLWCLHVIRDIYMPIFVIVMCEMSNCKFKRFSLWGRDLPVGFLLGPSTFGEYSHVPQHLKHSCKTSSCILLPHFVCKS